MEDFPQNKPETTIDKLEESAHHIAGMYIQAAEQYLTEEDPLRSRIIAYYTRPETEQELLNVLGKNEKEVLAYTQNIKNITENPLRFIEQMEKLYELQDTRNRRRKLVSQDRLATDEEYKLGTYIDVLESHIRDAVIAAQRKGYLTFQSGFKEKSERDQFMDFYNKEIVIPENILKYLQGQSVEIRIENFDDRTTLSLHPKGNDPIRLGKWKEIWDTLIDSLPPANSETVPNMKLYREHSDFRKKQDSLKNKGGSWSA